MILLAGSGGMLIQSRKYLIENNDDPREYFFIWTRG